jgi:hypothetical protein
MGGKQKCLKPVTCYLVLATYLRNEYCFFCRKILNEQK